MKLRDRVVRGGFYMAVRQGAGTLVSVGGALVLVRLLGPTTYGLFAAAAAVLMYVSQVSQLGVDVYLVRREGDDIERAFDVGFTILLTTGVALAAIGFAVAPLLEAWMRIDGVAIVIIAFFLGLPVMLSKQLFLAKIERELDFKSVAVVELIGQVLYYAVALPAAYYGHGVWAPVAGWWVHQTVATVALMFKSGYRPRLCVDWKIIRETLSYGLGYASSVGATQAKLLINPMIVGRYAGPETVGYIALAVRLAGALCFVREAMRRMSISVLAKMQGEKERLLRGISVGMSLQVIAAGVLLCGFGLFAPFVLPYLLKAKWMPVLQLYPFVALAYLLYAMFDMHGAALRVIAKNWVVTVYLLTETLFLGVGMYYLVGRLGGVEGYGWALVCEMPAHLVVHYFLAKHVGVPRYREAIVWAIGLGVPLFASRYSYFLWLAVLLPLALPTTRRQIGTLVGIILRKKTAFDLDGTSDTSE